MFDNRFYQALKEVLTTTNLHLKQIEAGSPAMSNLIKLGITILLPNIVQFGPKSGKIKE